MVDHDIAMLAFAKLAEISQARQQLLPRDKFLVLAGAEACQAGLPDVATLCRDRILAHNPSHLLKKFDSFAAALTSADFQQLLKQLIRFCSFERAELLLQGLGIDVRSAKSDDSRAEALGYLEGDIWESSR